MSTQERQKKDMATDAAAQTQARARSRIVTHVAIMPRRQQREPRTPTVTG